MSDFDALAKQYGGTEATDYDSLAAQFNGTAPTESKPSLLKKGVQIAKAIPETAGAIAKRVIQTPLFLSKLAGSGPGGLNYAEVAAQYTADPAEFKRKLTESALDLALIPLGGPASTSLAKAGLSNAFTRTIVEGAGIGATYEGIDAAVAGESAKDIAHKTWQGVKYGAIGGAVLHAGVRSVGVLLQGLSKHASTEAATAARAAETIDPTDMKASLNEALKESGITLPDQFREAPPPPKLLGPGAGYEPGTSSPTIIPPTAKVPVPLEMPGIARLREQFPEGKWDIGPVGIRSSVAAKAFPLGETVYDVNGRPLRVSGYAEDGHVGVQSMHPSDQGKVGMVGISDVTLGPPTGFIATLNNIERGAKARAALRSPTVLRTSTGIDLVPEAANEVGIALGHLGRVYDMAQRLGWNKAKQYEEWARAMTRELGEDIRPRLHALYLQTNRSYGQALRNTLTRDSDVEESLHEAVARMKEGGFIGKDWYDVRQKLEDVLGPERTEKFIPLLAIFSPRNSVEGTVTKALQGLAQSETGIPTKTWLPAHQMNFDRWLAEENRISGQKANSFGANLSGDMNRVTLDMWMRYFLGGKRAFESQTQTFTKRQYELGEAVVRNFAREYGLDPAQMQASMWTDEVVQREVLGKMVENGISKPSSDVSSLRDFGDVTQEHIARRGTFLPEALAIKQTLDPNIGGGTWYYGRPTRPMDHPGYVVALVEKSARHDRIRPKALTDAREETAGLVKSFRDKYEFTTGTWHDPAEGKVWVGMGVILDNLEDALALGKMARQQSVAELGEGGQFKAIHETGNKDAGTLTVAEAREVLKKFQQRELPLAKHK